MCSVYKVDQNKVTVRVYVKDTSGSQIGRAHV